MTIQNVLLIIAKIDGWLSSHEGYFLYTTARKVKGVIVEIGSWKGKSTICLASGLEKRGLVYAVDPHEGKFSGGKKSPTLKQFEQNLKQVGVSKNVRAIVATSEDAAKKWKRRIDFLFIDGLHDYKHTYQDFSLWSPFIKLNGIIAFHDAFCGHDGPKRVILEEVLFSNKWHDVGVVGSIIFAKKGKAKTFLQKCNLLRHRILITSALKIDTSSMQKDVRFLLIHRIIKILLLNEYTYQLTAKNI